MGAPFGSVYNKGKAHTVRLIYLLVYWIGSDCVASPAMFITK